MCSVDCVVCSVEWGVFSVECAVWSVKCGVWSVECAVQGSVQYSARQKVGQGGEYTHWTTPSGTEELHYTDKIEVENSSNKSCLPGPEYRTS